MTGREPRRRALPLLAGLALGAVLAALGVLSVVPASWSVALAGQRLPSPESSAPLLAAAAPDHLAVSLPPPAAPTPAAEITVAAPPPAPSPAPAPVEVDPPRPAPPTTRAVPTTAPVPVATGPAARVVVLTNAARERAGCAPLQVDDRITAAAQAHSGDMAAGGYFAHDSRDGRSFADRIRAAGYPAPGAENIAKGQRSAEQVVGAWLDSPGHRRNIEDCSLRTIGVGYAPDGYLWTQDFGR